MQYVAMGDPQAPFATVMTVLETHGLLSTEGRLRDGVHLISLGDHFDWGLASGREEASRSAIQTLTWLASHPPSAVTILAGNHDLARVCELALFDDSTFAEAQGMADDAHRHGPSVDKAIQAALIARYPQLPDAEIVYRDCGTFRVAQRELVSTLLRSGRMRLATSVDGLLFVHAGVTVADLRPLGLDGGEEASKIADTLNMFLDEQVHEWAEGTALDLQPFHCPGNSTRGEGLGALYHRPADPTVLHRPLGPPPRRRFDPRELPLGLTQVIGHIRDAKCRELMPNWCDEGPGRDGLRSLKIVGEVVEYRGGVVPGSQLIFADAGMNHLPPAEYPLFDVTARAPLARAT